MSEVYLTEIHRQPEDRSLRLTWSDGHRAEFDFDYLRGYCPCASCQGHNALQVKYQPPPRPVTIDSIEPVGNYAVAFAFSDGHGTGIYRFDFLRTLCPCPKCAGAPPAT